MNTKSVLLSSVPEEVAERKGMAHGGQTVALHVEEARCCSSKEVHTMTSAMESQTT